MPGYRKSKYSPQQTQEMRMTALSALLDTPNALTIEEICSLRPSLAGATTQKMARVLNELVERGVVAKAKSKRYNGRMVYKAVAYMDDNI